MKQRKSLVARALVAVAGTSIAAVLAAGGVASATITLGNDTCDLAGAGTAASPYTVATAEQLQEVTDCSNIAYSYYKLTGTISLTPPLTESPTWNDTTTGWKPISGQNGYFSGVFDGNGKSITGLKVNSLGTQNLGLFGRISQSSVFNLTLAGTVTGGRNSGALAGVATDSTFRDIASSVVVTSDGGYAGGLIGNASYTSIDSVTTSGKVQVDNSSQHNYIYYFGGIVGYTYYSNLSNVKATGGVEADRIVSETTTTHTAATNVGGIVGEADYSTIDGASSTGAVVAESYVGGIVGYAEYTPVSNATTSSAVTATGSAGTYYAYVGGAIGYLDYASADNVSSSGAVKGPNEMGGLVGYAYGGAVSNSKATGTVTFYRHPDGTQRSGDGYYIGGLVGDLEYAMLKSTSTSGALTCGNSAKTLGCEYIGGAVGYSEYSVLSGVTSSRSVTLDASAETNATTGYYAGGLVGYADSATSIVRSTSSGAVATKNIQYVGGLVGYSAYNVLINKSSASSAVTATMASTAQSKVFAGGLVGCFYRALSIVASSTSGNVTATGTGAMGVGGLVGGSEGTSSLAIRDSYARGNVSGNNDVAGIVGAAQGGSNYLPVNLKNVYFTGNVVASTTATGADKHADAVLNKDSKTGVHASGVLYMAGASTVTGAAKKTSTQLKSLTTYTAAGYSSNVWAILSTKNGGYAYLK